MTKFAPVDGNTQTLELSYACTQTRTYIKYMYAYIIYACIKYMYASKVMEIQNGTVQNASHFHHGEPWIHQTAAVMNRVEVA